jgi:hypothetical protein
MKQKTKKITLKKKAVISLGMLGGINNFYAKTSGQPTCNISTPVALCIAFQNMRGN